MKLLVSLIFISIIAMFVYLNFSKVTSKKQKHKKIDWKPIVITTIVTFLLLIFLAFQMHKAAVAPDTQCGTVHKTISRLPAKLESAMDYFIQGNYDYDTGNCGKAINNYNISILLNPLYPQTYNNRAYTYMRMRDYKDALSDLNQALVLNPDYIQALMNRGDIHNYYFEINKQSAVVDYTKVISLGRTTGTSVCGHLFLAKHNGWNLRTVLDMPQMLISRCK